MGNLEARDPFKKIREKWFGDFPAVFGKDFEKPVVREPLVDIVDRGKDLRVLVELPGIGRDEIEITVEGDYISIQAEQKHEATEEKSDRGYYFHEKSYQKFYRKIPLPAEAIPGKNKVKMKNGVLEIILQKKAPAK